MPRKTKLYWDACVFLSLVEGTPDRIPVINALLDESTKGEVEIYTSILSITEVAFGKIEKDQKILDPAIEARIDKLWLPASPFKLVDVYTSLLFDAKDLMRAAHPNGWSLKPADAIHLATAKRIGADEFQTYDDKLTKYDQIVGVHIAEPSTQYFIWQDDENSSE